MKETYICVHKECIWGAFSKRFGGGGIWIVEEHLVFAELDPF